MKKRFSIGTVLALMLLVASTTFLISMSIVKESYNARMRESQTQLQLAESSKFLEAKELILSDFVGDVDSEALMTGAIDGMLAATGDRWSYYLTAEQYKTQQETKNSYVGIGVSVTRYEDGEYIRITQVNDGSPAQQAGIEPMDVVIRVEGVDIADIGYEEAVSRVRGEEHTFVSLTLRRPDGSEYTANIQRRQVATVHVTSEMLGGDVGYVRISSFSQRVEDEFALAVDNLVAAGAKAMLFDVRFNPGGELNALVSILDKLLPNDDTIIIIREKSGDEKAYTSDEISLELPMAVLVNADSYSAAEFFAACLQEYGLASVVGEKTVGKGYAQHPLLLKDGSCIYLSAQSYYTPKGRSLEKVGIEPDLQVTMSSEEMKNFYNTDHSGDKQFKAAYDLLIEGLEAQAAAE